MATSGKFYSFHFEILCKLEEIYLFQKFQSALHTLVSFLQVNELHILFFDMQSEMIFLLWRFRRSSKFRSSLLRRFQRGSNHPFLFYCKLNFARYTLCLKNHFKTLNTEAKTTPTLKVFLFFLEFFSLCRTDKFVNKFASSKRILVRQNLSHQCYVNKLLYSYETYIWFDSLWIVLVKIFIWWKIIFYYISVRT